MLPPPTRTCRPSTCPCRALTYTPLLPAICAFQSSSSNSISTDGSWCETCSHQKKSPRRTMPLMRTLQNYTNGPIRHYATQKRVRNPAALHSFVPNLRVAGAGSRVAAHPCPLERATHLPGLLLVCTHDKTPNLWYMTTNYYKKLLRCRFCSVR